MISKNLTEQDCLEEYNSFILGSDYFKQLAPKMEKLSWADKYAVTNLIKNQYNYFMNLKNMEDFIGAYQVDSVLSLYELAIKYYQAFQFYGNPTYVVNHPVSKISSNSYDSIVNCIPMRKGEFLKELKERPVLPSYKRVAVLFIPIDILMYYKNFKKPEPLLQATYMDLSKLELENFRL